MRTRPQNLLIAAFAGAVVASAGCAKSSDGWQRPQRSFQLFQSDVVPVLLRDCAFPTCHGSSQRFFRVWGPGRTRLDPTTREFDPLTPNEAIQSYQLAVSMVDANAPSRSLLLRKPLAVAAGGARHLGEDKFGRNLYRTVNASGYLTIARWVLAVKAGSK
jgi:hypothetical protein